MARTQLQHVIVDGSNIATEGRDLPSLSQLDEAVQAFIREYEPEIVTVVVDASFPNRIARSERHVYEDAHTAGEIITPPAGAIGRGDGFILQIADRAGATVLSNDSFQEFHGEYEWLFEPGRLIGGKPVPHVGWVFIDRAPVRGPTSRRAVSAASRRTEPRTEPRAKRPAKRNAPAAAAVVTGVEPEPEQEPELEPQAPPAEPRKLKPVEPTASSPSSLNDALSATVDMIGEQVGHLLIELAEVILDHAQLFERELQQPAVDRMQRRTRLEGIAQLLGRRAQARGRERREGGRIGFTVRQRLQHAAGADPQ